MIKRSITLAGHKTSLALEAEFWLALEQIARQNNQTLPTLITQIDKSRTKENLSSAIRVFTLQHFQNIASTIQSASR
ncbi:MAG: ribbon-helix-helix domain-containing protein [Devosiaceae bacterium]|nr:ribbon-helix-helix domain-containing protein [Devosiaceae bacterium]